MSGAINHDIMRNENMLTILRCIQENGPVYRKHLKELTGFSWGTISTIVNELLDRHFIVETKNEVAVKGRNPSVLDIHTEQSCVIGIDINIAGITIVQVDLKCEVLYSTYAKIGATGREAVLGQIAALLDSIGAKSQAEGRKVLGIGVAMQGSVSREGISIYTPYFQDWNNVDLVQLLTNRYQCPVFLEHSPNCMALYETWLGSAREVKNLLFIRLGTNVGMSIFIDGKIVRGCDGFAGELGHTTVKPDGELCTCGNYGCLETVVSKQSMVKHAIAGVERGEKTMLSELNAPKYPQDIDMDLIYRASCMGDGFCLSLFEEMAEYLGMAVSNVINLLNPELVVIGGEMVHYESLYMDRLREVVGRRAWKNARKTILTSPSATNTASIGGSLLVIQKIFSESIS